MFLDRIASLETELEAEARRANSLHDSMSSGKVAFDNVKGELAVVVGEREEAKRRANEYKAKFENSVRDAEELRRRLEKPAVVPSAFTTPPPGYAGLPLGGSMLRPEYGAVGGEDTLVVNEGEKNPFTFVTSSLRKTTTTTTTRDADGTRRRNVNFADDEDHGERDDGDGGRERRRGGDRRGRRRDDDDDDDVDADENRTDRRRSLRDRRKDELSALSTSTKIIKVKLQLSKDIITYLVDSDALHKAITSSFQDEACKTQIKIAILCITGGLKADANFVLESMAEGGIYDLDVFFDKLFYLNFPSPTSTLMLGFEQIKQGSDSIVEFSKKFRLYAEKLHLRLKNYLNKYINGLSSEEVRDTLRKFVTDETNFNDLVSKAVSVNNNLAFVKKPSYTRTYDKTNLVYSDEDTEVCFKIYGLSMQKYFDAATKKQANGRCFQCMSKSHKSVSCGRSVCLFCGKVSASARHLSLLCSRCPDDLTPFFEARDNAKEARRPVIKFAEDFTDFAFGSDLSD